MGDVILELKGITKIFPGVKALDDVSFDLRAGEVHAIMGENGAGKSTFIKVITGVNIPEHGDICLNGERVVFSNPKEALERGISAIYQHVTCYPDLSVTENIFLGHERVSKVGAIRWNSMHEEAETYLRRLSSDINPRTLMGALSVAQQQIVEIAKALSAKARIIIMDEPTAALTSRESEELYRITDQLRDEGCGIIFISHRLEDMYRLADRVTVFRDSKYIGTWDVKDAPAEKLILAMVGRELTQFFPSKTYETGGPLFEAKGLSKTGYFKDVSFDVRAGEIVALTGLVGAGRSELCQAMYGYWPLDAGVMTLQGKTVEPKNPSEAMDAGIGYLPEDRQKQGLVLDWGIGRNITLSTLHNFRRFRMMDEKKENTVSQGLAARVLVKANSIFDTAKSLSGGNQQKVIVAKLLASELKLIIMDEPTKGVDVGAKYQIYEIMRALAAQGFGILMVSSEMPEVLGLSDRIVVMRGGRVSAVLDTADATQEKILEYAMTDKKAVNE